MHTTKNALTTSRIDHPINTYFYEAFLRRAMPKLIHEPFGVPYVLPAHEGDTAKWRRYTNPSAQATPLGEVNDPTPILMSKTDLTATLRNYGAWIKPTTWLDMTGLSADKRERTRWLGDSQGITIDTLCRDHIAGTASSTTCSNGSPTATQLNKTDVETVVRTMLGEEAEMIESPIPASTGQGTSPIRPAFIAITHVDLVHQIERIAGFKHFTNYASFTRIYNGEWGSTGNVHWLVTNNAYTSGSNYYVFIIAEQAFGNVKLPAVEDLLIFHPASQAGSALELYSTYGWKSPYAGRILNDNWIHMLICTSS